MYPRLARLKHIALHQRLRLGIALVAAAILGTPSVLATGLRVQVRIQQEQKINLTPKARAITTCIQPGGDSVGAKVGVCGPANGAARVPAGKPSPAPPRKPKTRAK